MIVKNEAHIICKTFDNILKHIPITYWVISDTGSTDNTIELIKAYWKEKNIDGELVEHAWKDFGYNRTKALECAYNKTDYLLIFDADDSFHGDFKLPAVLDKDSYNLKFGEGFEYVRPLLINNRRRWKFVGVLHEFLSCCEQNTTGATIDGNYHVESGRTGNRSQDPKKYEKDAKVLEMACQTEKDTSLTDRYAFYCAQSWKDAGEPDNAIQWYKKCLTLNNWYQEKYYSCLMIGNLYKQKGDNMEALKYWLKTTEYDGERMEGIAEAVHLLRESGMNLFVCALYKKYKGYRKRPIDKLFIDITKYDSIIEYNASISAYYCGKKEMGIECCRKILMDENASPSIIFATFGNIHFYEIKPDANLFERVDELICKLSRAGHSIPQSGFDVWNKLINKDQLTKYSPIKNKKPTQSPKIILTMTTCKRFDLFQQTVNSITNMWADIDMIDYWFCVDDNSSPEDRTQMKRKYNWIDYYMKGPEEKGHRKSMNIIWEKLNELRPTYWIHMEDDFRFHCSTDYIKTGMKYLEGNIKQVLFNRNYGEQIKDYSISGHAPFGGIKEIVLHDHKSGSFNYPNCHYWTDYSFRPSIIKVDAIIALGNYDSANQFFEKDYADRWYGAGFRSAFFNRITCEHIGKLTSDKTGANAYTMNEESQFVKADLKEAGSPNKIKVINLLRRPDRHENVIQKFKSANITNYEFIDAVDGKKLTTTPEIKKLFTGNDFGNRRGVIGCALSHYNLWKQLINDTAEYYIIMEDDFELCENFKEKMNKIKLEDYELIFFGYHMFENERDKVRSIYNVESDHTVIEKLNKNLYIGATHCYSINRKGAIKILEYIAMNGIKHGIDYLMKISNLDCYESRPHLAFAEWNENGKNIDTDIQNNNDSMNLNEDISNYFDFIRNQDQIGNDLYYNRKSIDEMMAIAHNDKNCAGFNTLGFFKNNIDISKLTTSPYFSSNDGIYIKRTFEKHTIVKNVKNVKNVKLLCNWKDSESICSEFNLHNTQNGIEFNSNNPDYYVIINYPINNEYYDANKTIVFQMEPWVYDESKNWGVKTWGEWARPDESKFLRVYKEKNLFVKSQCENIKQNKINKIVSICSHKNHDAGHILRNNFIRRINDELHMIDVFGRENYHNFSSYVGQLEDDKTYNGYSKYKYAFCAENNAEENYATEKIYEPIMCECLCFYWGCPNLEEFLNPMAFVRLDLNDVEGSLAIVKKAIEEDWWSARINIIREEKERIIKDLNFFKKVEDIIKEFE